MNKHLYKCKGLVLTSSQQELLKWLAMALMTLDHADKILWQSTSPTVLLGRLAFPLFVFLMAYNLVCRGVKPQAYMWPLLLSALVSQPIAMHTLGYSLLHWNIMATLWLGVVFICLMQHSSSLSMIALSLVFFFLALLVDYGPAGVFLLSLLWWFLRQPSIVSSLSLFVILLAVNRFTLESCAPLLLIPVFYGVSRLELSLPRIKKLGYWFYPLHLLTLMGIRLCW